MLTFKTRGKMGLWRKVTVLSGGSIIKSDTEGRTAHTRYNSTKQALDAIADELTGYAMLRQRMQRN